MRTRLTILSVLWAVLALVTIYLLASREQSFAVAVVAWFGGIVSLLLFQAARSAQGYRQSS